MSGKIPQEMKWGLPLAGLFLFVASHMTEGKEISPSIETEKAHISYIPER